MLTLQPILMSRARVTRIFYSVLSTHIRYNSSITPLYLPHGKTKGRIGTCAYHLFTSSIATTIQQIMHNTNLKFMKLSKFFSAIMLIAAVSFSACKTAPIDDGPTVNPRPKDTTTVDAKVVTVAEAIELCNALEAGASSTEKYSVTGVVSAVQTSADKLVQYGNCNFTLQDETGSIGCYYTNYLNNQPFTSADQALNVGDTVTVISPLKSYVNKTTGDVTPELANGYIASITKYQSSGEIKDVTFAEAVAIGQGLASGATTPEKYRITGVITRVTTKEADFVTKYSNCNFIIADLTGATTVEITCYYTNWLDNQPFTDKADMPKANDTVTVVGPIQNYKGTTVELYQGYIESIIRGVEVPVEIIVDDDSQLNVPAGTISCAEAIALGMQLADGAQTTETYFIKGIVTKNDTYASSFAQYGNMTFFMVDNLEDTVSFEAYQVFGLDSAKFVDLQQVQPGNVVVVKAPIYRYGNQIETAGSGVGFVYSTTNTFVPSVVPEPELPEGTQQAIDFAANALNITDTVRLTAVTDYTVGDITLTIDPTGNKSGVMILNNQFRMYKSTTIKLAAPAGKNIKYIAITAMANYGADRLTADSGEIVVNGVNGVWTGSANEVTLGNNNQVRLTKLLVVFD